MNIVETDFWCLMLPPEWSAEEEEGSVLITDQDGIGELAITTLVREPDSAWAISERLVSGASSGSRTRVVIASSPIPS